MDIHGYKLPGVETFTSPLDRRSRRSREETTTPGLTVRFIPATAAPGIYGSGAQPKWASVLGGELITLRPCVLNMVLNERYPLLH